MSTAIEAPTLERQRPTVEKSNSMASSKLEYDDEKESGAYDAHTGVVQDADVGEVFDDVRAIDLDETVRCSPLIDTMSHWY